MSKRMIIMLVLTVAVFGGVLGMQALGTRMMNQFLDAMPEPPVTVATSEAEIMLWDNRLSAIGNLVALNGADIATEIDGIVTAIHFESGQQVEAGSPLIDLNAAVEEAELQRLRAQARLADLNRKRQHELHQRETLSQAQYDTAVAETDAANAAVQAQEARLALKRIRAPFAGRLGIRRVAIGQHLGAGTIIATLQSLDPIEVDFALPERHLNLLEPGLTVEVSVDSLPGERFSGEVLAMDPKVETGTRNVALRARLPNADHKLRPGQFAQVRLLLPGERELVVVPRTAVRYTTYGNSIFVLRALDSDEIKEPPMPDMRKATHEVVQRIVELGEARGDYIAVLSGLEAGEEIAVSGVFRLRNGQPVVINNDVVPQPQLDPQPTEG